MNNISRFFDWIFSKNQSLHIFIFKTTIFTFGTTYLLLGFIFVLMAFLGHQPSIDNDTIQVRSIFSLIFLAPLVENTLLVGAIELFQLSIKSRFSISLLCGLIAGILHAIAAPFMFIAGFIGFSTMAYSYMLFNNRNFRFQFFLLACQHVILNIPFAILQNV